jgi:molecular chaperone GrpE
MVMSKEDKMKKKGQADETIRQDDHQTPDGSHSVKSDSGKEKEKENQNKKDSGRDISGEWQVKYDDLNDKYIRLYSEFDNYRKRTQKERIEFSRNASEEIILSLLPVLDDMERALTSTLKTPDEMEVVPMEGIQLIYQKFKNLLSQKGLEVIPAVGERFNVDYHDAITNIPAPSEEMKGKVVDEVEKGYKLNDKVIRYSKVVVGN